jgi:hypothetical protein
MNSIIKIIIHCIFRRQVYWSLANGRPLSSKITFSHDGQVLRIVEADASHSGLYRCTDGMSSVEIHLLVEGKCQNKTIHMYSLATIIVDVIENET